MGATTATLIGMAVSAGISAYGNMQQAEQARRTADYNAAVQRQNADRAAAFARYETEMNAQRAQAQADAQNANAISLENQALGIRAQGREQQRRQRAQNEKALSALRANYAASGVQGAGSPLLVVSDTAGLGELGVQDIGYEADLNSRLKLREAAAQRYGAGFSLLDASHQAYQGRIADAQRRIAYQDAKMTQMAGEERAKAYRGEAMTSLLSGFKSVGSLLR